MALIHPWIGKANLRRTYEQALPFERVKGEGYWQAMNDHLLDGALQHGVELFVAAGVFCALSPNNNERQNLKDTWELISKREKAIVHTYPLNKEKALRIWNREHPSLVLDRKTLSMFRNITQPGSYDWVTVDGHMVSCWEGKRLTMDEARCSAKEYEMVAKAIKEIALGIRRESDGKLITGGQLQAVLWLTHRRLHKIFYKEHMQMKLELDG